MQAANVKSAVRKMLDVEKNRSIVEFLLQGIESERRICETVPFTVVNFRYNGAERFDIVESGVVGDSISRIELRDMIRVELVRAVL